MCVVNQTGPNSSETDALKARIKLFSIVIIDPALFQENERTAPEEADKQFIDLGPLQCEAGGHLASLTVAYQTWGKLNSEASNAILICHALTGDSNVVGWWDRLVGPGRPIDTNRYFVIGSNALGGCQGTTGPSSLSEGGVPFAVRFPVITVGDLVEVQAMLMDHLGISTLHMVAGGSMGGMQALEWSVRFPTRVKNVFITASCAAHTAMQIGFNEAARQAIMRDPRWQGGYYAPDEGPVGGLCVARMIGHLSFLSEAAFESKFARRYQDKSQPSFQLETEFQVESYLSYQGEKFTKRFDANSLLYLTRAIDYFEIKDLSAAQARFLFISFKSDWLYPSHQSEALFFMAQQAGLEAEYFDIDLPYGHDAFLLDGELQGAKVRAFLDRAE